MFLVPADDGAISFEGRWRTSGSGLLSGLLERNHLAADTAVFDSRSRLDVEQRPLQRPESLRRQVQRQRWQCGRCWLAQHIGAAARQAVTILALGDVEDAYSPSWLAARPRQRPPGRRS